MHDRALFSLVAVLIATGVVMVYSLSTYVTVHFGYPQMHYTIRQLGFGLFSIIIMWIIAQLNPDKALRYMGFTFFIGGLIAMIFMPFMPDWLVTEVNGAKRWIRLGPVSVAPVEFFKIGFVYFLAWSFSRRLSYHPELTLRKEALRFAPYAFVFLVVMFLIAVMQKDLGQVVVLGMTMAFMLFVAGSSLYFFLSLIGLAVVAFIFFIVIAEHRINRFMSWWSIAQDSFLSILPETIAQHLRVERFDEPYQISHSLNAIHNGGLLGQGLGCGTFKLGFLSEVHTDFVLAGIAEEFGFLGVLAVSGAFLAMVQRIFKIANKSKDDVNMLFCIGVGMLLAFAFLINAYGISGLTPIKGIAVPFLSYGGSSMMASAVGVGMVLMASKKVRF